ncbi:MAG: glycosyltransferase involved in cell wall biosynthesis [Patiriisocius sp.]|jgi:glycosyltransferase involved in cell wall biosynthesis
MKVLQINTTSNSGSTGRIAEEIGKTILRNGDDSYIGYSRSGMPSSSLAVPIGNRRDVYLHVLQTRLFDTHGFGSKNATKLFLEEIEELNPDIIHLHNIHGYYLNIEVLFQYLEKERKPVVWTFHDCWPFTGHCTYFDFVNCEKWKTQCEKCPNRKAYPSSWIVDNSKNNFKRKKELFTALDNVHIVTPSKWLHNHVKESFLKSHALETIHNGIDLDSFKPTSNLDINIKYNIANRKIILGVASIWDKRKGLEDFLALNKLISSDYQIVLVGLNKKQLKEIPETIIGIARTESLEELAELYSVAEVFINPTYVDNFPTTNIESLACGTPVITYNTGGSPEAIDEDTGKVVEKGDVGGLWNGINQLSMYSQEHYSKVCRTRAEKMFNKEDRYMDYLKLYEKLIN